PLMTLRSLGESPGEARYLVYNEGGVAEWLFGQTETSHDFTLSGSVPGSGTESDYFSVSPDGVVTVLGTIDSTSSTGGALNVNGGMGIHKDLVVGDSINVSAGGTGNTILSGLYRPSSSAGEISI